MDDVIDTEYQFVSAALLFLNAVDATADSQVMWIRNEALVNDGWSQRTECVHGLSNQKLATVTTLLPVTSGYILCHRVSEDMIQSVFFANMTRHLANDHG